MAQATRCPNCQTTFRVVADQLRLHQGLVRCGRCQHVFNGLEYLFDVQPTEQTSTPETTAQPEAQQAEASPVPTPTAAETTVVLPTVAEPAPEQLPASKLGQINLKREALVPYLHDEFQEHAPHFLLPTAHLASATHNIQAPVASITEPELPPSTSLTDAPPITTLLANEETPAADTEFEVHVPATSPIDALSTSSLAPQILPEEPASHISDVPAAPNDNAPIDESTLTHTEQLHDIDANATVNQAEAEPQPEGLTTEANLAAPTTEVHVDSLITEASADEVVADVSFLQTAKARSKSRHVPLRKLWLFIIGLLVLGALLQLAWWYRTSIAYQLPFTEPWLQSITENMGEHWEPVQRIDALVIEQSDFQKVGSSATTYALNISLRNKSDSAVAMPAIELSLTDLQGQMLTRKVILPKDYLGQQAEKLLHDGLPAGTEAPVRLQLELKQAALNYRVLIFYP